MKALYLSISLLIFTFTGFAQSLKDVYETLAENDRFSNMMNLRHYLEQNPDHAVGYYLLGKIYDEYLREGNPILLFSALESDYLQQKTYYGLARFKLDEKQARQDRDYFGDIEQVTDKKKISLPDILNDIEVRQKLAEEYFRNAQSVHDNYYRCINKYNECLFKFRKILSDYPNYKNLYLLATPDLVNDIHDMALNFDSALVFFENYSESCSMFPHLLSVSSYKLQPIITYRLEGLVETDFTAAEVLLWDFKAWANNFLNLINTDVASIRSGLIDVDNALDKQMERFIRNEVYSDEFEPYLVDVKFQNLIGKYDHSSLANNLIDYKKEKVNYLMHTRSETNNVNDSLPFFLINKLWFFRDLMVEKEALNQTASALKKSTSIDKIALNIDFYGKQYNGMDGFLRWCEVEKYKNNKLFDDNLSNLREFIIRDENALLFTDSLIVYNKKSIPVGKQIIDANSLKPDTICVIHATAFKNRWLYQAGFELDKDSILHLFIMKIARGKVDWMKNFSFNSKLEIRNATVASMQILDDSTCWLVGHYDQIVRDTLTVSKIFVAEFNWQGGEKMHYNVESELVPTYFWFDEINERYLLVNQGEKTIDPLTVLNPMTVTLRSENDSLIWTQNFNLKGTLVNVIPTNSDFLLVCNYSDFSYNKTLLQANYNSTGIASIYINRNGEVKRINNYTIDGKVSANSCYKLSNSSINLIGETEFKNKQNSFYLLTNEVGEVELSNVNQLGFRKFEF